jgi:membrane protein
MSVPLKSHQKQVLYLYSGSLWGVNVWQFWRFIYLLGARFERNENRKNAAQLTFVTLFAIVPLMTSGYVFSTWLPGASVFTGQFQDFLFQHFIPSSGEAIQGYLKGFSEQARQLTWFGLTMLLLSALSLLLTIENAFNKIWRVNTVRMGRRIIMYWLFIVLAPVFLAALFFISSYLLSSKLWVEHVGAAVDNHQHVMSLLPLVLSTVVLASMYYLLPSCNVRLRHALVGALMAGSVLEAGKQLFVYLVTLMPSYQIVYGAFAVIPLFLLWLFVAWNVVLLGAELVRALPFIQRKYSGVQGSQLDWALLILQIMSAKSIEEGIDREDLVTALSLPDSDKWEEVINVLLVSEWIVNKDDRFYLGVNLASVSVAQLTELIHRHHEFELSVLMQDSCWFEALTPVLAEFQKQKKTTLGLSVAQIINQKPEE